MPRKNNNTRQPRNARAPRSAPDQTLAARARTAAEDKLWAALHANPNSTTVELAIAAGIGKSTAGKILAAWATEATVTRASGIAQGGRRGADRWAIAEDHAATVEQAEATVSRAATAAGDTPTEGHSGTVTDEKSTMDSDDVPTGPSPKANKLTRLGKGQLRDMVKEYLTAHPDEQFSPSMIGKALSRSSGAVNNALEKLVADGYAVQTQGKPKRFAAKPPTDESAK